MADDEYGPWIAHDGSGQPVPTGTDVRIRKWCGCCIELRVEEDLRENWYTVPVNTVLVCAQCDDVLRTVGATIVQEYQVRRPKGMAVLREALNNVDTTKGREYEAAT